mgnify:CR=1 FL=1
MSMSSSTRYTDKATNSATVSGKVLNTADQYAEIVGKATSIEGAQSVIYWNAQAAQR